MRNGFASEITNLAITDETLVLLSGDIGNRLFDGLKSECPTQVINCGIAEQNMMSVAAGMALSGLKPVVYTIAPFATTRCLEQIKIDLGYQHLPVVIIGTGSGLSYAKLGPTHHSLEDFAILRSIPGIQIMAPWDVKSIRTCLDIALNSKGPTYIRIGKKGEPDLTNDQIVPEIGCGLKITSGCRIAVIAVGCIAPVALDAAGMLAEKNLFVDVVLYHTVKPLRKSWAKDNLLSYDKIFTVEEHSKIGGFGDAVRDLLDECNFEGKFAKIGADDEFIWKVGSQNYARKLAGISADKIFQAVHSLQN